eukprot:scaffold334081_cov39-Prasinocladus_malaysianus.AAC.1
MLSAHMKLTRRCYTLVAPGPLLEHKQSRYSCENSCIFQEIESASQTPSLSCCFSIPIGHHAQMKRKSTRHPTATNGPSSIDI